MADENPSKAADEKKKKPKTVVMVMVILIVEAVAIVGAMMFLGGSPAEVAATADPHQAQMTEDDKIVETKVLDAKMPNNKSGITYLYATEVYVQTKKKHADQVKAEIEQFQNEIKSDVTAIWRTSEPQHFQEPKLETLTRKVYALLNERFGNAKGTEEPVVLKVVVVMSTGFRIDS